MLRFPVTLLTFLLLVAPSMAQSIPMTPERWAVEGEASFITHRGVEALQITNANATLKDITFSDGTITFDVDLGGAGPFVGLHFRADGLTETEYVYLRGNAIGSPKSFNAVQYAPLLDGVNLWDLLHHLQGPAPLTGDGWNQVKLVIHGQRLRVYVNDMTTPVLEVPELLGRRSEGALTFIGRATFANVTVQPGAVEDLPATAAYDPTAHDAHFVRAWQVTSPIALPKGRELTDDDFPTAETPMQALNAERGGLVNLTRAFGASNERRYVWLKTTITAPEARTQHVQLGFSDEVWVFVNGGLAYVDKNLWRQPIQKMPFGRLGLENGGFDLQLQEGDNEILIGVANDFFGWGLMMRIDQVRGLMF
ncbi:MAG: hypothetical protein RhofKO_38360 [Rhodothermales bacterium]